MLPPLPALVCAVALCWPLALRAQPMPPARIVGTASSSLTCHEAAQVAEQRAGLPPGMLDAIGRVESGRPDPATGQVWAWPWAVNAAGEGRSFASLAEAASYVRERQAAGVQSIDVGCFQINLLHHPDAFATLDEGFDPAANAAYAARFLSDLHQRTGGWAAAIAAYHSATPGIGEPYRDMVLARWPGHDIAVSDATWHGRPAGDQPPADHVMIGTASPPSFGIRIWTPSSVNTPNQTAGTYSGAIIVSMHGLAQASGGHLPHIITASR